MDRRSKELDKYIGLYIKISFKDGSTREGFLNFDEPKATGLPPSHEYTITDGWKKLFFRKSHVKKIIGVI